MAGYQFVHIESYARQGSKQGKGKWSVRQIIAEANREPGHVYHVENPQKPKVRGMALDKLEKLAQDYGDNSNDAKGRKLRKDAPVMLAGVISLPRQQEGKWEDFRKDSIKWLQKIYGDRLKTVVEHQDEAHPHIHFYAVPNVGERFEVLHNGKAASAQAKAAGKLKGDQNRAYKEAMRLFQDQFGIHVAQSHGLARIGPGRRRLTREAWKLEEKQAEALANVKAAANSLKGQYKKEVAQEWQGLGFVEKTVLKMGVGSKTQEEQIAQAKKETQRVRKEYKKMAKTAQERLSSGLEHARDARESGDREKELKKALAKAEHEKKALQQQLDDAKALTDKKNYRNDKKATFTM